MQFMISQPMSGISKDEIQETRARVTRYLENLGHTVVDSYFIDEVPNDILNRGVYYLAKSIETMSKCDGVFFCERWQFFRGCTLEHEVAKYYGIPTMYE